MAYGYADDPIAAQVQLYHYWQSADVGELESLGSYLGDYGVDLSWVDEAITGTAQLVGTGMQIGAAARQTRQQQQLAEQQAELLAQQAAIQAQIEEGKRQRLMAVLGVGTVVGGIGLLVWQWPVISKKLGL